MKSILITSTDLARCSVLMTALKRGKWDLEGEEILAFAQVFHWASEIQLRIKESLAKPEEDPITPPASVSPDMPVSIARKKR